MPVWKLFSPLRWLYLVTGSKIRANFSTNKKLLATCRLLLWILIGSTGCLLLLWLVGVITLVSVSPQSFLKFINNSWRETKGNHYSEGGLAILIIIKIIKVLLWIFNALRSYIKHSKEHFIRYQKTSMLVTKNSGCASFFNHFSVFGYLVKHFLVFDILLQNRSMLRNESNLMHGQFW